MDSLAGSILFTFLHALLLLPVSSVQPLLPQLLSLLAPIDKLNRLLPPLPDDDTGLITISYLILLLVEVLQLNYILFIILL